MLDSANGGIFRPAPLDTGGQAGTLGHVIPSGYSIPPRWRWLVWALVFVLAGALFVERATQNARNVNTVMKRTDQGAYVDLILRMRVKDFNFQGDRNRMPLYPAVMALGVEKDWTKPRVFEEAKIWNIWMALFVAAVSGVVFFRFLPAHAAANALFLSAFTVLLFKAPHVQAEIQYYLLFFLCFVTGWRLFQRPSWWAAAAAGVLAGLAHLTKASIAPAIVCFVVFHALDTLWRNRGKGRSVIDWSRRLAVPVVVVAAFLLVVWNYISESKRVYGHYFYNVNSTFYFWCDSWQDAVSRTKAAGDRHGWPDMPEDEIPSARNFLREHGVMEIPDRLASGFSRVWKSMARSYGYFPFVLALAGGSIFVLWRRRVMLRRWLRRRPVPALALLAFFGGYFALIAWYSQIISGNRFILGLFLPYVLTTMVILHRFGRGLEVRLRGKERPFLPLFHGVFSIALFLVILRICTHTILVEYGGM